MASNDVAVPQELPKSQSDSLAAADDAGSSSSASVPYVTNSESGSNSSIGARKEEYPVDPNDPMWLSPTELDLPIGSHIVAPITDREELRLKTLEAYDQLDRIDEDRIFDALTAKAANIFGADVALISLIDGHRQFHRSRYGIDQRELSRDMSLCAWAIRPDASKMLVDPPPLLVDDALKDRRFAGNPLVRQLMFRGYAGVPLVALNQQRLGVFCVITKDTRSWTQNDVEILRSLAAVTMREMELRRNKPLPVEPMGISVTPNVRRTLQLISHDLRTPLQAIVGTLEDLQTSSLSEGQKKSVDELVSAVDALTNTVSELTVVFHDDLSPDDDLSPRLVSSLSVSDNISVDNKSRRIDRVPSVSMMPALPQIDIGTAPPDDEVFKDLSVLVVDDVPMNRLVLHKQLESIGVRKIASYVEDGFGAIAAVKEEHYDVVFMDLQMPRMGGTRACSELVAAIPEEKLPWMCAITADTTPGVHTRCAAAGFREVVTKPLRISGVKGVLGRAILDMRSKGKIAGGGSQLSSNKS